MQGYEVIQLTNLSSEVVYAVQLFKWYLAKKKIKLGKNGIIYILKYVFM